MATPWDDIPEDAFSEEDAARVREEVSAPSLASLAGFMIAAALGPRLVAGGARRLVGAIGRRAAPRLARLEEAALRTSSTAEEAAQAELRLLRRQPTAERVQLAAAMGLRDARASARGSIDLSRFAQRAGLDAPIRLRERAAAWHRFKRSEEVRRRGVVRSLFDRELVARSGGQRRLLTSAFADYAREQAAALPVMYALDTYAGITQEPGAAPALYDLPGHVGEFVRWLPRYMAYDVAGRAAMALPGLAKWAARGVEARLASAPGAARAISRAFTVAEAARRDAQRLGSRVRNAYHQQVSTSTHPLGEARRQAGRILREGLHAAGRRLRGQRRGQGLDLHEDVSLRGVIDVVGGQRQNKHALFNAMRTLEEGQDASGIRAIFRNWFVEEGERAPGYLGRLFNARPVTLGEVRHLASGEARKQITLLERELERFRRGAAMRFANPEMRGLAASMEADRLRVAGYLRIGGEILRMPTGADLRHLAGRTLDRATTFGRSLSLFKLFHLHALTEPRASVSLVRGALDVEGAAGRELHFFGKAAQAPRGARVHARGFAVADFAGSSRGRIFGYGPEGPVAVTPESQLFVTGMGSSKLMRLRMRAHYDDDTRLESEEVLLRRARGESSPMLERLKATLGLGGAASSGGLRRVRELFGPSAPRRLFARTSPLWTSRLATQQDALRVADAVTALGQARVHATSVYTHPELFRESLERVLRPDRIRELGGVEAILHDDRKALEAARIVADTVTSRMENEPSLVAPSYGAVRRILAEASHHSDHLFNTQGASRGQTLRRFLFEQGALGTSEAGRHTRRLSERIDELVRQGRLRRDLAAEAKAGLVALDVQLEAGRAMTTRNPYRHLRETGGAVQRDEALLRTLDVLRAERGTLEAFARTRPRLDARYHRKAFTETDLFGSPYEEAGFFTLRPGLGSAAGLLLDAGLDTTREALSHAGLGWDARISPLSARGRRELGRLWGRRALALGTAYLGYTALDTALDVADVPLFEEGLTMAGAHVLANARLAASRVHDALGITDAARYFEGLMPKSMSTLPGAALGYWAAGWWGALAGAAANRMTSELLRDTPLEALSIVTPLAPFVSDLSESYEETLAKYEGRSMVPVRKGRYFLLSSSDFAGGRITQWRPNWYTLAKGQPRATPALYGSKLEQALFRDLPLLDVSVGDLLDPHYLQKVHYYDRPYVSPDLVGSDIPLIGPAVGRTFGRLYNALHPMASNRPLHLDDIVGTFEGEPLGYAPRQLRGYYASALLGNPFAGMSAHGGGGIYQDAPMGPAFIGQGTIVGADTLRASYDEQFYRISEAMGFSGFILQQAMGGEGLFRDPVFASASEMDSTGRAYHDLALGDLFGIGEAVRRLYPFARDAERLGPRNTMPGWMPDEFRSGDPYCLLPQTRIEVGGYPVAAEEAFALYERGRRLTTRTHLGRERPITAVAVRMVAEEVVTIRTAGLPWDLSVTKAHPVYVLREGRPQWVFAGDVAVGDKLLEPVGERRGELLLTPHRGPRMSLPLSATTSEGLLALARTSRSGSLEGLSDEERYQIERGLGIDAHRDAYDEQAHRWLRRRMAEGGMPPGIVGMDAGALRPFVMAWGRARPDGIVLELTAERLGTAPGKAEALERGAYTLMRAFDAAGTPVEVEGPLEDGSWRLVLRGTDASPYIWTHGERRSSARPDRHLGGLSRLSYHAVRTRTEMRRSVEVWEYVVREVVSVEAFHYEGPVYAFEVEGDASFVAAGLATHNSKIEMGEAVLPGAGLEALGMLSGERELSALEIGADPYETSLRMLGLAPERKPEHYSWAEAQVARSLMAAGAAVRERAVFVDERTRLMAVAHAATQSGQPIHIEALSDAEFRGLVRPRELDVERINAMIGAARRTRGMLAYVNAETGQIQTFVQNFDSGLYNASVRKLQTARALAKEYAAQGYGAPGALYSTVDRLQVLLNAGPFSEEWRVEMAKAKALYASGVMTPHERYRFAEITKMQQKMGLPFEIYNRRFSAERLLSPDEHYHNLTYNERIQAAASYSLPERLLGSVFETWSNLRTPLHTKFFGAYSFENEYERRVLLQRDFQSWSQPVDDFLVPYMRGLIAAHDPLQGALSYGVGGFVFGGAPFAMIGAAVGTVYGAVHGAARAAGYQYTPGEIERLRESEQTFDRIRYYRAQRLYQATRDPAYLKEMSRSAYGWTQEGLSRSGWAKDRRRSYAPAHRLENPLYAQDAGFGSPWRGLKALREGALRFRDVVLKGKGDVLTLGEAARTRGKVAAPRASTRTPHQTGVQRLRAEAKRRAGEHLITARRSRTRDKAYRIVPGKDRGYGPLQHAPPLVAVIRDFQPEGLSGGGLARMTRRANTQVRGNLGFGSPWRGQDPFADILWYGYDPTAGPFPPELFTIFPAAPESDRDFMRAMLLETDPEARRRIRKMVAPDTAAMLEVGWAYLAGEAPPRSLEMAARPELDVGLTGHPVMGMGAYVEGYQIRTMEDLRLDAHDAGLGWKEARMRLERAVVSPTSVAGAMQAREPGTASAAEMSAIIRGALAQMGILVEVRIAPTSAPSEIHFYQTTGL